MRLHFIQHVPFEHPGHLLKWADKNAHSFSTTHIYNGDILPSLNDFDMLIIMGGPMGAYEENKYTWLKTEKQFIEAAIDAGKKVLGICLGSQVIANVLGANVYPHTQKEIGWWPVKKIIVNKNHLLINQLPDEFITFHWHGDTFDLPAGAIHLFKSDACEHQGFLYSNHVAGLQFHPEVEDNLLHNMTEHDRAELVKASYVQTEEEVNKLLPSYIEQQHQYIISFMDEFVKL
jgi:GMP synthase-like glutamine amidotransferase